METVKREVVPTAASKERLHSKENMVRKAKAPLKQRLKIRN